MENVCNLINFHRNFNFFEINQAQVIQKLQSLKERCPILAPNKLCTGQPMGCCCSMSTFLE